MLSRYFLTSALAAAADAHARRETHGELRHAPSGTGGNDGFGSYTLVEYTIRRVLGEGRA